MQGNDIAAQLEQEQHNNSKLHNRLLKANEKRVKQKEKQETARKYIRALEERLSTDRHLKMINQLWQQLQDARATAQHKQAEQELQDLQADSVLANMTQQLKFMKRQLAAAASKQSDLQHELQSAQQQSLTAAQLSTDLQETQQQLACAIVARDAQSIQLAAAQQQGQEWAQQRDQAHSQALAQADRVLTLTRENLGLVEAAEKAEAERTEMVQQATAGVTAQLALAQAEIAELRRHSGATSSQLQSRPLDSQKAGAIHTATCKPKHGEDISLQKGKAGGAAKLPIPKAAGKSAVQQRSRGKAVANSRAPVQARGAPERRKQPSRVARLVSLPCHCLAAGCAGINATCTSLAAKQLGTCNSLLIGYSILPPATWFMKMAPWKRLNWFAFAEICAMVYFSFHQLLPTEQ